MQSAVGQYDSSYQPQQCSGPVNSCTASTTKFSSGTPVTGPYSSTAQVFSANAHRVDTGSFDQYGQSQGCCTGLRNTCPSLPEGVGNDWQEKLCTDCNSLPYSTDRAGLPIARHF